MQRDILKHLKKISGCKNIKLAIDGCGVPTFALPIKTIALLFSRLSDSSNPNYKKIISAMTKNPFYVGGTYETDTEIMKASKNRLLAKGGGGGILIVAYKGNSAVIKIADGSPRIRAKVTLDLLIKLKWLNKKDVKSTSLKKVLKGNIKNHAGKIVGKMVSVL